MCIVINEGLHKSYKSNILVYGECVGNHPNPIIKYDHTDAKGRIYIPVENGSAYPNSMFRSAPELPPCGTNTNSSRTWIDIYNADNNARIYGFCGFTANTDLKSIWFMPPTPNGRVYIIINDRACTKSYKSNVITYGECVGTSPNPVIKYDHKDAEGRIYIPVENSSLSECYVPQSSELPPCGTNTSSSRTWIDIYNADNNARIYGFCGFTANTDLKSIWFMPPTPTGRVYIIINDRACKKNYKSNTINWH